jgi:hypothetical protein
VLHVTNGGIAAEAIAATAIGGEVLAWRDVLHEGPVPCDVTIAELRTLRASFLARSGWAPRAAALADLEARDRRLERALASGEEVVLWFEPDLYDQLQLLQVLDRLSRARRLPRLGAVLTEDSIGSMRAVDLVARFAAARAIGTRELELGRRGWSAFRAADPRAIEVFLGGDTTALPQLRAALERHLEQFPDTEAGLSRSERQGLEALAEEPLPFDELFRAAQAPEEAIFLGDAVFEGYLAELATEPRPLLEQSPERRWMLTATGRSVLAGERDRVALRGIDRWLGGVRLRSPRHVWRWDRAERRLVPPGGG